MDLIVPQVSEYLGFPFEGIKAVTRNYAGRLRRQTQNPQDYAGKLDTKNYSCFKVCVVAAVSALWLLMSIDDRQNNPTPKENMRLL